MSSDWMEGAACRTARVQTSAFFPERRGDNGYRAKRVCAGCPVRELCLAAALDRHEDEGIWGGAGEALRRRLGRLLRAAGHVDAAVDGACDCGYHEAVRVHFERLDEFAATGRMPAGAQPSFGVGATHGNAATAAKGCKCLPCRFAGADRSRTATGVQRRRSA